MIDDDEVIIKAVHDENEANGGKLHYALGKLESFFFAVHKQRYSVLIHIECDSN